MDRKIIIVLVVAVLVVIVIGFVSRIPITPPITEKEQVLPEKEVIPREVKKLFFIHSYDPENICGVPQDEGAVEMLKKLGYEDGKNIKIYRFYMDTKKTYTTPEAMKERGDMALEEIEKVNPDVVFILDDNAFRYVAFPLAKSKYPTVFSGMNGQIEDYDKEVDVMESREHPGYNITGVLETVHYAESFLLLQKIVPNVKKVLCISDATPTGKGFARALQLEMEGTTEFPVQVEFREVSSYKTYKELVLEANEREDIDAILPAVFGLSVAEGRVVQPEITGWTIKNLKKPDVGLTFFLVGFGNLSGAAVDFPALGSQAAVKIAKILEGAEPGNISIDEATSVSICVNLARAEQLGIEKVPLEVIAAADKVYTSMKAYPEYKMKER